jgi:hypothetical protein
VGGITGLVAAAGPVGTVPFRYEEAMGDVVCRGGMLQGLDVFEGGCGAACVTGVEVPEASVFPTA